MILLASVLLLCVKQISSDQCIVDRDRSEDTNWEKKLWHDIVLGNYDARYPPHNITTVRIRFLLKSFAFDENEEVFSLYSSVFYYWMDERLKWDPVCYENISSTFVSSLHLWTPRLKHQNGFGEFDDFEIFSAACTVHNTGQVTCAPRAEHDTVCTSNLTNWPFDTQMCTFKFGPPNTSKDKVQFILNSTRGISMLGAEYGPGWNIIDFEKKENPNSTTQFYFTFVVERQGIGLAAVVVVPSIVMSVLTVSSLFLHFGSVRFGITFLSLVGHFYFLQELSENIPNNSAYPPVILRFITCSLFFTTAALILSFILRKLDRRTASPPRWVASVNEFVLGSPGKYLIWSRLEISASDANGSKKVDKWVDITNIINSITIWIGIIVYFVLLTSFMPKEYPIDYTWF